MQDSCLPHWPQDIAASLSEDVRCQQPVVEEPRVFLSLGSNPVFAINWKGILDPVI
jgi:hypothetical protein